MATYMLKCCRDGIICNSENATFPANPDAFDIGGKRDFPPIDKR